MLVSSVNLFSTKKNNFNFNFNLNAQNRAPKLYGLNQADTVSFSSRVGFVNTHTPEEAEAIATKLSTSTSGIRRPYDDQFKKDAALLTQAIAAKLIQDKAPLTVMVGGDMRYGTKILNPQFANLMRNNGFTVFHVEAPAPTPALALATREMGLGITNLNTASHNNWRDVGFNLLTNAGAVADQKITVPLVPLAVAIAKGEPVKTSTGKMGQIITYDPYNLYSEYLNTKEINGKKIIDFNAIKDAGIDILYDDFGGTGSYYLPKLLEEHGIDIAAALRTFTDGPEPNAKNMRTLANEVKNYDSKLKIGLANDGDSDRFGVVDENGNFISANDVLLLAAYHLNKHKGYNKGNPIIRSSATSSQLDLLADKLGLKVIVTPTGFKYIGEEMIELEKQGIKPVICGEESGGLTIGGHIPEKDGFLATLLMAELMAYEKKPIGKILRHIKEDIIGTVVENSCTNYATPDKFAFIGEFKQIFDDVIKGKRNSVFGMKVDADKMKSEFEQMCHFKKGGDGVKIFFENGSSVLVRLSGTEDKARVYKEIYSNSPAEAEQIKNAIEKGVAEIAEGNGAQAL